MTRIILVRHGETLYNQKGNYYGSIDCSITEKGIQQAEKTAQALQDTSIDIVISSPLKRAVKTAEIILRNSSRNIILEPRFKELDFGLWEGLHYTEVQKKFPIDWEAWGQDWIHTAPTKGESFIQLYNRVMEALEEVLQQYCNQTILIAAHHSTLKIIELYLTRKSLQEYWTIQYQCGEMRVFEGAYNAVIVDDEL